MNDLNHKSATFNLLRLVSEQRDQIRELRLHIQALEWAVTDGKEEEIRRLAAMQYVLNRDTPISETERDRQWESWLLSKQREIELDRVEIPN